MRLLDKRVMVETIEEKDVVDGFSVSTLNRDYVKGRVTYVGDECTKVKVNETVYFSPKGATKMSFMSDNTYVINQDQIIMID